MKDKRLYQPVILAIGGEHYIKQVMKDYICDSNKDKPLVVVNNASLKNNVFIDNNLK